MFVYWTNDLSVGVEEIDDQHKELFNQVNKLLEACESRKNLNEVERDLLTFMNEYVVHHFEDEENLMRRHDYPDYTNHLAAHNQFEKKMEEFSQKFEQASFERKMLTDFNYAVVDWFSEHIHRVDRKLGKFLALGRV